MIFNLSVLVFAFLLFVGALGPTLKAQDIAGKCNTEHASVDSSETVSLDAKAQWLAHLRYRDASGGTACCFDEESGIRREDFSSIRYCNEGYNPQLALPSLPNRTTCPAYFGDEKIDAPIHFAMMIGAKFFATHAGRDTREK